MNKICIALSSIFFATISVASTDVFYEVKRGNNAVVKQLLQRKENLNLRNNAGRTLLIEAVLHGNFKMVKTILKSRVNVNALDDEGKTALDWAVEVGNGKIAYTLVKYQARVTRYDNAGYVKQLCKEQLGFSGLGLVGCFLLGIAGIVVGPVLVMSLVMAGAGFDIIIFGVAGGLGLVAATGYNLYYCINNYRFSNQDFILNHALAK